MVQPSLTPDHPMTCTICCAPGLLRLLHPRVGEPTRRDGHPFPPSSVPKGPRGPLGTHCCCRTDSTGICKHFPISLPSPCELISKADTSEGVGQEVQHEVSGTRQAENGAEGRDLTLETNCGEGEGGSHGQPWCGHQPRGHWQELCGGGGSDVVTAPQRERGGHAISQRQAG